MGAMTTDNRTNEITEEQVEAAWQSLLETATDVTTRADVRAALVAAQGAAPQAGSNSITGAVVRTASGPCHIIYTVEGMSEEHKPGCGHKPILQPSSTVDEGKIAEVVRGLMFNDAGCWAGGIDCTESVSDHAEEIARAVVEAIGGESRASRE